MGITIQIFLTKEVGKCDGEMIIGLHTPLWKSSFSGGPKCITRDMEVCEGIAIIRKRIAIVHGDRMAAACKLLSFASVILAVSPYCLALCYPWL